MYIQDASKKYFAIKYIITVLNINHIDKCIWLQLSCNIYFGISIKYADLVQNTMNVLCMAIFDFAEW